LAQVLEGQIVPPHEDVVVWVVRSEGNMLLHIVEHLHMEVPQGLHLL
jgi:hypothetical protein